MSDNTTFTARFFDGQKLQPFSATVQIREKDLSINIIENDKEKEYLWQFDKLQVMEPPHDDRDIVLGYKDMMGARLAFKDKAIYLAILNHIPHKNIKLSSVSHPWHKVMIIIIACSVLITLLLVGIPIGAPYIARLVPESWDDNLGKYVITQVSDAEECIDPEGKKALQILVAKLSKNTNTTFDVRVLKTDAEDVNAFAVPGNHIIILSGLLEFATSPDEVAGVLAHEMGHAIEHHPTQGLIRRLGINIVMYSSFGTSTDYVTQLLHLKHSREDEQRADDISMMLLNNANISNDGFANFFDKLAKEHSLLAEHEKMFEYFSGHPGLMDRMHRIQGQAKLTAPVPSLSPKEWKALKGICNKTIELQFE